MGIFNEFNKKEKPVFTGLRFGFGSGGTPVAPFSASGGTKIVDGDNTYFVFTSDGNFVVENAGSVSAMEVLIVGGGGGGGGAYDGAAGAGGGGGIQHYTTYPVSVGTIPVVVGDGGAKGPDQNTDGQNGADSSFDGFLGKGGGFGPRWNRGDNVPRAGNPGGSGGGGTGWERPGNGGTATQPSQTLKSGGGGTNYGNPGGTGTPGPAAGGSGSAGGGNPTAPGAFGSAQTFPNFPAPVLAPAIPTSPVSTPRPARQDWTEAVGTSGYFGAGGSRSNLSGWDGTPSTPAPGGFGDPTYLQYGGGGRGGVSGKPGGNAQPGVEFTGGGAAGNYNNSVGGEGGKGIVIVRVEE